MRRADDRQATGGVAAPKCASGALNGAGPAIPPGLKPRLQTLRVAAKTRFRMDDWMNATEVERALTELLTGHAGEPVTVGDYTTVTGSPA